MKVINFLNMLNMKIYRYIILLIASISLVGCNLNEAPEFDDNDAFIGFKVPNGILEENLNVKEPTSKGIIKIEVISASLSGKSSSIDFQIVDSTTTAVEGENYKILNPQKTLNFSNDTRINYIEIQAIDNEDFQGDKVLTISLTNPQGVNLGADKSYTLSITDDEHPLAFILGEMSGTGESNFGGALSWTTTFEKDESDLSKVWISNFVPGGSNQKVYGVVNEEKTEIKIPVGQEIAESSSYPKILLNGFRAEDESKIPSGENIIGEIDENGVITIKDYFGSQVFSDDAASNSLGWYEIVKPGAVIKK